MNHLAFVRETLMKSPSVQIWWDLIQTLDGASVQQRPLLQEYLRQHLASNEDWRNCAVPRGSWDSCSLGWEVSVVQHQELTLEGVHDSLVLVPPGTFLMGAKESEAQNRHEESPPRRVTLTHPFWMFRAPVTSALWNLTMGKDSVAASFSEDPLFPAVGINWFEAIVMANRLSSLEGLSPAYDFQGLKSIQGRTREELRFDLTTLQWDPQARGYRLPSEAEWEHACKAGEVHVSQKGNHHHSWHRENTEHVMNVRRKAPNPWGLYDLLGNVWEWTFDCWRFPTDSLPDSSLNPVFQRPSKPPCRGFSAWNSTSQEERFQTSLGTRVIRGGSAMSPPTSCLPSTRKALGAEFQAFDLGFRLVRSALGTQ